jgi:hypothetical protein
VKCHDLEAFDHGEILVYRLRSLLEIFIILGFSLKLNSAVVSIAGLRLIAN